MDFTENNIIKSKIVAAMYEKAAPASGIVSLSSQTVLAGILLVLAAVFGGIFATASGKQAITAAVLASVTLSFGSIFLADAVRVYTG